MRTAVSSANLSVQEPWCAPPAGSCAPSTPGGPQCMRSLTAPATQKNARRMGKSEHRRASHVSYVPLQSATRSSAQCLRETVQYQLLQVV